MILVLADDLSGAAELAGVAAAAGLSAEVQTVFDPSSKAEVIAVDGATRSLPSGEAARLAGELARAGLAARPAWIYKKTDSVLRGNVAVEVEAILEATGLRRVLFIPANPSRARIIRGGQYLIDDVPLTQTPFARDPEHPRQSPRVDVLLAARRHPDRWIVPDVASAEDLSRQAAALEASTLPAGAADFFGALLAGRCRELPAGGVAPAQKRPSDRTLFVCGSAAAVELGRFQQAEKHGVPVWLLPESKFRAAENHDTIAHWAGSVAETLRAAGAVMIAAGSRPVSPLSPTSDQWISGKRLAAGVSAVMRQLEIGSLLVEGGATARRVFDELGWTRLNAEGVLAAGLVALRPAGRDGLRVVVKPGSYDWPAVLWPDGQGAEVPGLTGR